MKTIGIIGGGQLGLMIAVIPGENPMLPIAICRI